MAYTNTPGTVSSPAKGGAYENVFTVNEASYQQVAAESVANVVISATAAAASEAAAAASEAAAAASEAAADISEANALASANAAALSASNADTSEANALASANAAGVSEANALASANSADVSEASALASANAADISEANALASASSSGLIFSEFNTRYLGSCAVAPTLDNNNNALAEGALYFNNVLNLLYVYTGGAWSAVALSPADFMLKANNLSDLVNANTARTNIGLGNVDNTSNATERAAVATLTNKTVNLTSNTLTGTLTQFNAALSGADFATGGGTATGSNTGDQTAATVPNTPAGNIAATTVQAAINELDTEKAKAGANTDITSLGGLTSSVKAANGSFRKADSTTVAFTKLTAGTAKIKAGTVVDVSGTIVSFASDAAITMPTLTAGTDYAIYACTDGSIRADASFSSPSGYTTANSRRIGGFHFAPGGNAAAKAGGDTTPQINEYSFWDLKFKPTCPDPRGMTLVANGFWTDIYLTGVDHYTNGTSKYNVTIADGSSPPKVPALFGGNGSTAYSTFNWWEAGEVARSHGKRLPTYAEFCALAYGTTEAASGGTDPVSTILRAAYTSKWGVMLATGNLWIWGAEFGGGAAPIGWVANTGGRGSTYQMANATLFGGSWAETTNSGSRGSSWDNSPTNSFSYISSRCTCDHLILE